MAARGFGFDHLLDFFNFANYLRSLNRESEPKFIAGERRADERGAPQIPVM